MKKTIGEIAKEMFLMGNTLHEISLATGKSVPKIHDYLSREGLIKEE